MSAGELDLNRDRDPIRDLDLAGRMLARSTGRAHLGCRQDRHLTYVWDGAAIVEVYEKRAYGEG